MINFKTISCVALAAVAASCFAPKVHAETVADAVNKAVFNQSGDIYRNAGIDRQATLLFGLSYPEHEYLSDAQSIGRIYNDVLRQRASEPVRTADLPNPFTESLLTSPPKN
jgi:hypothetical protein